MIEKVILLGVIALILIGFIKSMAYFLVPTVMLKHSVEYHNESARGKKRTLHNIKNGKLNVVFLRVIAFVVFVFFALSLKVLFKFI